MKQYTYSIKGTVYGTKHYNETNETWEMDAEELALYEDKIREMFTRDPEDELAQYIHPTYERDSLIYGVVTEIWVDVKVIEGKLYSWTEVTANRMLSETEKKALLSYLSGQFSDGYGEGLEQREFLTDTEDVPIGVWSWDEEAEDYEGEISSAVYYYLHLWNHSDFKLEFVEETEPVKKVDLTKKVNLKKRPISKPRCKLVGEDGNIFNLLGIARRALNHAGLNEKAKEMSERVMNSQSYESALGIICQYVEAV